MEFFDPGAIESLVKQCEFVSDEGVQLTKISLLQNRLRSELTNLTNVALGQRQLLVQEVQNVMSFVVQRNNMRLELAARRFYLEGWRQVLECLLATGALNELPHSHRWNILTQITQDIFSKCLAVDNNLPDLVHYLAGVMVILLAGLRACALEGTGEMGSTTAAQQVPSDYVRCLDGTILRTPNGKSSIFGCFVTIPEEFVIVNIDSTSRWTNSGSFDFVRHYKCYPAPVGGLDSACRRVGSPRPHQPVQRTAQQPAH